MKTKILFLGITFASAIAASAQPTILYKKAFGGTWYDNASSVQSTPDGGMVLAGSISSVDGDVMLSHGNTDAFIVKLDASGNVDWKHTYGGTNLDIGSSVITTSDGGYLLGGVSQSNNYEVPSTNSTTDNNYWFAKLDASGNVQWKKTYGGSGYEVLKGVVQLSDGTYIAGGYTNSSDGDVTNAKGMTDCWLVKMDANGDLLWQKSYGGSDYDQLSGIIATNDGGFAFTALTSSNDSDVTGMHGGYDIWMVKGDAAGNVQWKKCYGGSGWEYSYGLTQTPAGDYILLGSHASHDGDGAFTDTTDIGGCWVVKIDNSGNLLWENQYGGTNIDYPGAVITDTLGNYIIAATSYSNDGNVTGHHGSLNKSDYWVFSLDASGVLNWQRSIGGTDDESACAIALLNDGNIAVLGDTHSNNNGDVQNSNYHLGTETIHPDNSPAFTVNTSDWWVVKITSPAANPAGVEDANAAIDFTLAPNPAAENFTVAAEGLQGIEVHDLSGRLVLQEKNETALFQAFSVAEWNAGVYLVTIQTKSGRATRKLVVAH